VLVATATALGHGLPGLVLWTIVLAILAALAVVESVEARRAPAGSLEARRRDLVPTP
jgi:hypothetical protein